MTLGELTGAAAAKKTRCGVWPPAAREASAEKGILAENYASAEKGRVEKARRYRECVRLGPIRLARGLSKRRYCYGSGVMKIFVGANLASSGLDGLARSRQSTRSIEAHGGSCSFQFRRVVWRRQHNQQLLDAKQLLDHSTAAMTECRRRF
ncbi:MAG: hypothetical protein WD733_24055 [Bryobacterales bacterium]